MPRFAGRGAVKSLMAAMVCALAVTLIVAVPETRAFIYVGDSGSEQPKIGRTNLGGSGFDPEFIKPPTAERIGDLAVTRNHVYWADQYLMEIYRINLDGSGTPTSVVSLEEEPWGLTVSGNRIYGNEWRDGAMGSATNQGTSTSSGVAIQGDYLYWVDVSRFKVGRVKLDGSGLDRDFLDITGISDPWTIAVDWIRNDGANFKVKKFKKRKLTIDNPGPGKVIVTGKGLKKVTKKVSGPNGQVTLKPKKALKKKLKKSGKAKVNLKVTFRADLSGEKKEVKKRVMFR